MEDQYFVQLDDKMLGEYWLESFVTEILDSKYDNTDVTEVVNKLDHLSPNQKKGLLGILKRNQTMFDGTLGTYPHKKIILTLILLQNQCSNELMEYQEYTWACLRKNRFT